jgi:outer membrane protein insertion porin family
MTRLRKLLCAALVVLISVPTVAQTTAPAGSLVGQRIERFEVSGNTSVASDTIRVYLGVVPGDIYDPTTLRSNFPNLWQTGLFDDIRIEAEQGPNGVIVKAIVKERPRVGAVEYRGNKNLNASKIQEALEKENIDLHIGNTIEQTLVKRAAETIRNTYAEGGFEGVTVETSVEPMIDPGEQKIVFIINEGIKARVADIEFTGNERFSDRTLRRQMKDVKTHNLYTWIRKRNVYTPSKLQDDLEKVRNYYQDFGYKDVEFGDPKIETVGRGKPRVRITIPVREGGVHTFGEVSVDGNSVFTNDQIIGQWPLKKGETLRRRPIQNRIDLFNELYQRRGYIYAYMNPEYREGDDNVVDVHIQVYEGEQFKLGRLEFQGNTTTKDKVLRREIFLDEGDIMDMETFKSSLYKLGQLGYFKITENPDFKVNPGDKTVDVTIKGQEEGKNELQFGGGYNEATGFFGQFQFSTRNFLGEGENLGVNLQLGKHVTLFVLSYSDPWFLDRPHSFGVSVYNRETDFPDITGGIQADAVGGNIAYGFRLDRFESISFLYGLEERKDHLELSALPDPNGNVPLPRITDTEFTTSIFAPTYRFDSRDNPFDTTRGTRASVSLGYSGGVLGGTIDEFKPILNYSHFRRINRRSSVSFNVEAGQIFPQDSSNCVHFFNELDASDDIDTNDRLCIPQSERFYVGGYQSLRGFDSYSVGPKEEFNGVDRVVGGYKYNVFNLEYVYRINDPLRLVLFADAGNAYGYKADWDIADLRYSFGAELRIFLPVFQFPLRFIYAANPDPQPDDDFDSFSFSVGNTF